ncbi:MAG: flagellar hook-basal body complex protein FliE [Pseudomonadota bacterium]
MNEINTNSLLLQMRSMAARASSVAEPSVNPTAINVAGSERIDFSTLMRNAIQEVNMQQQTAAKMSDAFERGEAGVELTDVMIQMQKANVSFEAITQVRNRLVSAYQDIMNMPI